MEHCAVDPLAAVILVNETLIRVHHHHKVVVVSDWQTVNGLLLLPINVEGILTPQCRDGVIHPLSIPPFVLHLFL